MLEIRCTHTNGSHECGRFLAKLEGGFLILRCPLCKSEARIPLAQLVEAYVNEAREVEAKLNGEAKLIW